MTVPTDARPDPSMSDYERGQRDMRERAAETCDQLSYTPVSSAATRAAMCARQIRAFALRPAPSAPAQPQQPGGEDDLVEAVARALMDNCLGVGVFDRAARFFGHEVERDQWRNAAIAAIRVMLPDVQAQAQEIVAAHGEGRDA